MNEDSAGLLLMAELATDADSRRRRTTSYVLSELSHARASSLGVRGRTTRTPCPERKCLTLCVTSRHAPAPIAAASRGTG